MPFSFARREVSPSSSVERGVTGSNFNGRATLVLNSGEPRKRGSEFVWWRTNFEESSPPVNQTVNNDADKKAVVNMSPQSITNL